MYYLNSSTTVIVKNSHLTPKVPSGKEKPWQIWDMAHFIHSFLEKAEVGHYQSWRGIDSQERLCRWFIYHSKEKRVSLSWLSSSMVKCMLGSSSLIKILLVRRKGVLTLVSTNRTSGMKWQAKSIRPVRYSQKNGCTQRPWGQIPIGSIDEMVSGGGKEMDIPYVCLLWRCYESPWTTSQQIHYYTSGCNPPICSWSVDDVL